MLVLRNAILNRKIIHFNLSSWSCLFIDILFTLSSNSSSINYRVFFLRDIEPYNDDIDVTLNLSARL